MVARNPNVFFISMFVACGVYDFEITIGSVQRIMS